MAPTRVIAPWCDKIAAESAGKLKCQQLPAMSGGGTPPQLVDRVKDGVDDIVITLPGYTPGRFPSMEAFELPFMTNTAQPSARAAWDFYQKHAVKEFPGTKLLAVWVHDEGYIHTSNKQVKNLADLKGLKIRAPHRQGLKMLNALGATGVAMPIPGVQDAIAKGTLDGAMIPWEAVTGFRIGDVTKFHIETPQSRPAMYTSVFVMAMNEAKYNSLPADLKAVIDKNAGANLSGQIGKVWDESAVASRKVIADKGSTIFSMPDAEADAWMKATDAVSAEWIADMDKRGLNGRQLLQDAKDMVKKYNAAK
jgi:TRAP-type transport system periplasmic protein